jgi:hypothetical protein
MTFGRNPFSFFRAFTNVPEWPLPTSFRKLDRPNV